MKYQKTPLRGSYRSAIALLALLSHVPAQAEEKKQELEPLVISALRIPRDNATVTSAVTVLDPVELQNEGLFQLRDALNASPGVISTSTGGQTGAVGSLFIRGTTTAYSQLVLDGMRLSDSTTPLGNVLGAGRTYDVGRIEILRGPQGAIYGGESIGGVLWMETPYGSGDPHGSTTFEAGSFNSLSAHGMFQGRTGDVSYYLSGGYEETDNDGPRQSFHQANTALRVEGKIDSVWTVGTTFRAIDSSYDNSGNSQDHLDSALATIYATGKISDRWTSRFHAGYQQEFYDSDSSYGNFGTDLRAGSVSTDQEITLAENLRLLAGAFFHESSYENTIGTDESRERYGVHTALEWDIIENLTGTAALRWEDYDAYGDELTWRVGSIYNIASTGTSIRGGVGSSFRSPSYLDLFGSSFGAGNPDLEAESSIGWDIGVEQKIGANHRIEATWFHNHITDQIQSSPAPPVNISGDSDTDGLELGLRGDFLGDTVGYRLAWTYLHESLSDQPRNAATASIDWKPTDKSLVGIGATHLASHSWGGDPIDSYTVARLFASYQVTDKVKLHARLENAFDADYELASFFGSTIEGAGTGAYAGITVDW
ncbi:TonB-dependent receptor [Luteolibacter yonseiensis]|uniref:TonB-dependent receptor n=1 Tax=Luteolibacter yonseiensis TaxID=1144680 RepID=A0A934VAU5_9BACT|nr:TonB-dependent receptor [Luteolibacter yonseiensis]MBK1814734.1 TonB-dependent receptor [Luteolibacter yonseiensis]